MRAAVMLVFVAACGASSGEIRTAREAKYDAEASVVFEAMRQSAEEKYGIETWDEGLGTLSTQPMWFTAEGATAGRGTEDHPTQLKDDMVHLTFDLAIVGSEAVFARARFDLAGKPVRWTFLLIPDPASLTRLSNLLSNIA